ncbi:stage II sporulation protein M [Faecalicatena orotica]|nr:stage II sporulation protein M [Faecalicatena orotica]
MWKQLSGIRGKFLPVFLTGFAAGVLYMALFGRSVVHETTLLSRYFFSKYQQVEFASGELFLYILKSRMSAFTLLWLTGFTFFGTAASLLALAWVGVSLGITMTTAAMKMGFSGMLICLASGLPQLILYVPAAAWLLRKISEMSENRERRNSRYSGGRGQLLSYLLIWLLGFFLFFLGSLLESYVNPLFLRAVLKNI